MLPAHNNRAPTDEFSPKRTSFCDRCNFLRYMTDLSWQMQWAGGDLFNTHLLVCTDKCLDKPNEQFRSLVIGPDPAPIKDVRPGFQQEEMNQPSIFNPSPPGGSAGWGIGPWGDGPWGIGVPSPDFVED